MSRSLEGMVIIPRDDYVLLCEKAAAYDEQGCCLLGRNEWASELKKKNRLIAELEGELDSARKEIERVRKALLEACADVEAECDEKVARLKSNIQELVNALRAMDEEIEKKEEEVRRLREENERNAEKARRLEVAMNKDYTNSSLPSSRDPDHGRLTNNSREKTGRSPGGQPGHPHHGRRRLPPTEEILIPTPEEYLDEKRYVRVGEVHREKVGIKVVRVVVDYVAEKFLDKKTGKEVYAPFPDGVDDDVNYDESVKSFVFLLNDYANVSLGKIRGLMGYFFDGVRPSEAWMCGLAKEFAEKSAPEHGEIFSSLCSAPVLHGDFSFFRDEGEVRPCAISKSADSVLVEALEKRSIRGTPVDLNKEGILVCDGENQFANLDRKKQECLQHMLRRLNEAGQNEPDLNWHKEMKELLQYAIHVFNEYDKAGEAVPDSEIADIEKRYDEIIVLGAAEYELHPPKKGYRGGRSTFNRLLKDKDSFLLFLHSDGVPPTNNSAEVEARCVKRKLAVINGFRSKAGSDAYCRCISVTETMRVRGENIFEGVLKIFARPKAKDVPPSGS